MCFFKEESGQSNNFYKTICKQHLRHASKAVTEFFQPEKRLEQMRDMRENMEVRLVQQLMFIFTCI